MRNKNYISVRQQLWQQPVFSPEEPVFEDGKGGEPIAPTRHQVDCWRAEGFPATLDEFPYGRRDNIDLIATRAYQAGFAAAKSTKEEKLMTNQFPDATKMVLSPAAQAVLDATYQEMDYAPRRHVQWAAGAALRAAADQVVPAEVRVRKGMRPGGIGSTTPTEWMQDQRLHTRRHFLTIAAELEGSNG